MVQEANLGLNPLAITDPKCQARPSSPGEWSSLGPGR